EILPALDAELAALLRKEMPYVTFITAAQVERITPAALHYHQNGHSHSLPADTVLISQGRRPALSLPGLDRLDLDYTPAGIRVNDHMQTNVPGVYAIGDITGRSMWAHAAIRMAEVAVHHLAGIPDRLRDHAIPLPVYSVPEIASVGLTEEQARARGHAVQVARLPMNANGRFLIESEGRRGLCKAVVDAHSQVLLGLHMIGTGCADMIFGAAAMIEDEFRVPEIQQLLFAHPTLSEIIKDTLYELR
nr:FAD-dependent oxidoreductase [Anaerolineae bacterium]